MDPIGGGGAFELWNGGHRLPLLSACVEGTASSSVGTCDMARKKKDLDLPDWPRDHYARAGGNPLLFYVVFGEFVELPALSSSKYRSHGTSEGLELAHYGPDRKPDILRDAKDNYVWKEMKRLKPALAKAVEKAPECFILRAELDDRGTLNYFRDAIGLLTFLLDHGGISIHDAFMFKWWEPDEWRADVFEPAAPFPGQHVVLLTSPESDPSRTWFHTRGLRKFGRPELSIHNVPADLHEGIIDMCNRFIQFQAMGGIIEEGQEIRMRSLPEGMICHHQGNLDDPDFNNVHVDISFTERRN